MNSLSASNRLAVSVQDVSITYRTTFEAVPTFKSAIVRLGRGQRIVKHVEAVRNVSFDVPEGTVLGVIGSNGAGKSTLLRAIAGILPPTTGRIEVNGRVSTLLSLGVGFNPVLTGRENVILGGLAAGLSREQIEARYQEIADFADLGEFIDLPMRTYSSGMFGRLAFSVAVHMDPDILLIDEALSAGDARFKTRASARIERLCAEARTIILVSHALKSIESMCSEAVWLDKGEVKGRGEPEEIVAEYQRFVGVEEGAVTMEDV